MQYVPLGPLLYQLNKDIPDKSVMRITSDAQNIGPIADFTETETFFDNTVK
jgi:hypothetical protein